MVDDVRSRDLIFVSHANPADNDFVVWLGSRLSAAGYNVWADLTDLKAGSKHWRVIESKIRDDAAKVIVATSRASKEAEGVEQEINIAKGIEKELDLRDFIIQVKIDDLPYAQLPPALNNRLAIGFENSWGDGLRKLFEQFEEEGVPKHADSASSVELFSSVLQTGRDKTEEVKEPAFGSWLPIQMPSSLMLYRFPGAAKTVQSQLEDASIPAFALSDTVVTFALPEAVAYGIGLETNQSRATVVSTDSWRDDPSNNDLFIDRAERRKALNGLLNSAWVTSLKEKGFVEYRLANETALFLPSKTVVKHRYNDPLGRKTMPITLVGTSNRYDCFWHAALSARSALYPWPRYSIRLHVAFTKDGEELVAEGDRAFRLRRTFCKSFWNDRWRRILFALFARLADDGEEIQIPTAGEESIRVGFPFELEATYSISSDLAVEPDVAEEESSVDELDLGEFGALLAYEDDDADFEE